MSATAQEALAERLTAAIAANDPVEIAAVYADDATIWHSPDEAELTTEQLVGTIRELARVTASSDVQVTARYPTADGFVQTQINTYAFKDGTSTRFHAALVVRLNDEGRIARADEYVDGLRLQPLIDALSAPA